VADRYCRNCGQELPEDSRFCPNCGTPIQEAAHVPTPEADVPVPPPPSQQQVGGSASQPQQQATIPQEGWRQRHPILTGCLAIIVLLFLGVVLSSVYSLAVYSGGGDGDAAGGGNQAQQEKKEQPAQEQQRPAQEKEQPSQGKQANEGQNRSYGIGDTVPVGDVSYKVTGAKRVRQLPDPYRIDPPMKGNFILITFVFTNNGNEAANVSDIGLYLYDSQNREYETDTDATMNLPQDKSIFLLERVNPGLTRTVQTVYSVPPDAKGFELEVTSGFWATESARISLGF
jgi:hypothetical protein